MSEPQNVIRNQQWFREGKKNARRAIQGGSLQRQGQIDPDRFSQIDSVKQIDRTIAR